MPKPHEMAHFAIFCLSTFPKTLTFVMHDAPLYILLYLCKCLARMLNLRVLASDVKHYRSFWHLFRRYTGLPIFSPIPNEPRQEKTCLWGLRLGNTQTGLRSHID